MSTPLRDTPTPILQFLMYNFRNTMDLTNSLLKASLCKTREEAQQLIRIADKASQKMSGTCYGFEYNNEEHMKSFEDTHQ